MAKSSALVSAILATSLVSSVASGVENRVTGDGLNQFSRRLNDVAQDISDAAQPMASGNGRALNEANCMYALFDAVETLTDQFSTLEVSVTLAELDVDSRDRKMADGYSQKAIVSIKRLLTISRRSANAQAGLCRQSATVNQKVHDVLTLFSDAESILEQLSGQLKSANSIEQRR